MRVPPYTLFPLSVSHLQPGPAQAALDNTLHALSILSRYHPA